MSQQKKEYIVLAIILFLGFIIRLYNYANFSLSNDELSAIYRLNFSNLHDIVAQGVAIDFHPAGVQIFLYYWTYLFGNSVASIRLPFILAGTLSILFMFLFSRRWFSSTTALLSAASIAFLSFPIMYSQIARPYSSGLLLILVLAWLWSIVLFPSEKEKKNIYLYSSLLAIAFAFNLYNHYFSALLAFIIGISAILFLNKQNYKSYFLSTVIGSILFIPHIKMTLHHFSKGGLSTWLGAPNWDWPIGHIEFIFNSFIILGLILIVILILRQKSKVQELEYPISKFKIRSLLLLFFILPIAIGLAYSIYINPILQDSILIFSMPFILVWIFSFAPSNLNNKALIAIGIISLSFIISSLTIHQERAVNVQNFKGIAEHLQKWHSNNKSNSTTLGIMDSNSPDYIKYYLGKDTAFIQFAQWKIQDESDLTILQNTLDTSRAQLIDYVILAPSNELAINMIINQFPYKKHQILYAANAMAFEYTKDKTISENDARKLPQSYISKYETITDTLINLQPVEYSNGLNYNFSQKTVDSQSDSNYIVYLKATFLDSSAIVNSHIVFSINYDNNDSYWSSAPLHFFIKPKVTKEVFYKKTLPLIKGKGVLKVYIWNPKKDRLSVSDFKITLNKEKPEYQENSNYRLIR